MSLAMEPASEVVPDPEAELHAAEVVAAAHAAQGTGIREDRVFPGAIEERLPGPVEVHREAEQEALQAEAIGRAAVDEAEAVDLHGRSEDRYDRAEEVDDLVVEDRVDDLGLARQELEGPDARQVVEAGAA